MAALLHRHFVLLPQGAPHDSLLLKCVANASQLVPRFGGSAEQEIGAEDQALAAEILCAAPLCKDFNPYFHCSAEAGSATLARSLLAAPAAVPPPAPRAGPAAPPASGGGYHPQQHAAPAPPPARPAEPLAEQLAAPRTVAQPAAHKAGPPIFRGGQRAGKRKMQRLQLTD